MNKSENNISPFANSMIFGEKLLDEGKILKITAGGFSMFPAIRKGDIIYIKKIDKKSLKKGDVVVFKTNLKFIAHRLVKIKKTGSLLTFFCKGDSRLFGDKPIKEEYIIGKIIKIERDKKIFNLELKKAEKKAKIRATLSPFTGFLFWLGQKFYFKFRKIVFDFVQ